MCSSPKMEEDQFFFSLFFCYMSDEEELGWKTLHLDVIVIFTVAETMHAHTHRNIFSFHFNCCSCLCSAAAADVYRYATLPLSFSSLPFFVFFFFDSIDARNGECSTTLSVSLSLSLPLLLCYNPFYSRPLMSFLLCAFVFCFDTCHMYIHIFFRSRMDGCRQAGERQRFELNRSVRREDQSRMRSGQGREVHTTTTVIVRNRSI